MRQFLEVISRLFGRDGEQGQTLVEYALIVALISVALVGALTVLAGSIDGVFSAIGTAIS